MGTAAFFCVFACDLIFTSRRVERCRCFSVSFRTSLMRTVTRVVNIRFVHLDVAFDFSERAERMEEKEEKSSPADAPKRKVALAFDII